MNEADRIIREQERRKAADRARQASEAQEREQRWEAQQLRSIEAETSVVLRLLQQQGYPNMVPAFIEEPRFGLKYGSLGYKQRQVASWKIGEYRGEVFGDAFVGDIFLLSDGRFNFAGGRSGFAARDLDDIYLRRYLHEVLQGLRELRLQVERRAGGAT